MLAAREEVPLTPERLLALRQRFVRRLTLAFGGAMWVGMVIAFAPTRGSGSDLWQLAVIAAIVLLPCSAGGYVFALVLWQRERAFLETREYERKKRSWPKAPDERTLGSPRDVGSD